MNAGGRIYGPFTNERMKAFVSEARLVRSSLVAPEGSQDWKPAGETPELAPFFVKPPLYTSDGALAAGIAVEEHPETGASLFAVVVDQKSSAVAAIDKEIANFGESYRLLPNVWIIAGEQSVGAIRNRLFQVVGKTDAFFVIDATRGKASWSNFGPEADAHIRNVWKKPA